MKRIFSIALRLLASGIMLQTLYFKFTGQPESIYIFTQAGIEPWGRIGTGIAELIASILLLIPRTVAFGALMSVGLMLGAVATHIFILGLEVQGDGGQLFAYALIVLFSGGVLFYLHREEAIALTKQLFK